jgi:hypothetical protein
MVLGAKKFGPEFQPVVVGQDNGMRPTKVT